MVELVCFSLDWCDLYCCLIECYLKVNLFYSVLIFEHDFGFSSEEQSILSAYELLYFSLECILLM